ncbi:hypothetical protein [Schlesneria sp.]|uniref:hypothetical protein n=1 Tax=Schlesneria sp. TaxID=2762018 RepID=UPI002EE4E895
MRSDARRRIVAKLVAEADTENSGDTLPLPGIGDQSLPDVWTPELLVRSGYTGPATVCLLAEDARPLDIANLGPQGEHPSLVVFPASHRGEVEGGSAERTTDGNHFCLILSPELVERLVSLGIEDVASHFRGKSIRVSGTIERQEQEPPHIGLLYRMAVISLDQLIRISPAGTDETSVGNGLEPLVALPPR